MSDRPVTPLLDTIASPADIRAPAGGSIMKIVVIGGTGGTAESAAR
ncbi:MAG TPA: hypothetical protein VMN38_07235 [Sphingomicrobium sp.]|nr:hypothetical protein [Sphingomicrobium sp.]